MLDYTKNGDEFGLYVCKAAFRTSMKNSSSTCSEPSMARFSEMTIVRMVKQNATTHTQRHSGQNGHGRYEAKKPATMQTAWHAEGEKKWNVKLL